MGFLVLPASIPDIRQCYDTYFAAFADSVILKILFPWDVTTEEFRAGHTAHTLDYWHKDTTQYTCKCIDTDTGEIVGMGLWDVHWKDREGGPVKTAVDWLQGAQKERAEALIIPMNEKKESVLGPVKHVCKLKSAFGIHEEANNHGLPHHRCTSKASETRCWSIAHQVGC